MFSTAQLTIVPKPKMNLVQLPNELKRMVFKDAWNFTPTWIWHKYWGVMVYTSWLLIDWEKPFGLYHNPLLPTDRHSSRREKGLFYDYYKWREYDREYVSHSIA